MHLDAHLLELLQNHGAWVYLLLFAFIFVETGLVVMPFLPGDSLLFVTGTLAASGGLHLLGVLALLIAAAVAGDAVNFAVGTWFRRQTEKRRRFRWPNPEHLRITNEFFERHGGKTIILARFVPIVRTFAPFVAGVGGMRYRRFALFNVSGAVLWVVSVTLAGYQFGNIGWVKQNLTYVLLGIVVISVLPGAYQWIKTKRAGAR